LIQEKPGRRTHINGSLTSAISTIGNSRTATAARTAMEGAFMNAWKSGEESIVATGAG